MQYFLGELSVDYRGVAMAEIVPPKKQEHQYFF